MIFLISYQLFFIYLYVYKIKLKDPRVWILSIAFYSSIFNFVFYALLNYYTRPELAFIIEFNRYIMMYSLCWFYCSRGSHLLTFKDEFVLFLHLQGVLCTLAYIYVGIRIYSGRQDNMMIHQNESIDTFCTHTIFEMDRWLNCIVCFLFIILYLALRSSIKKQEATSLKE